MAEIFLQHIEKKHIMQLLDSKNIILYTRYVDDINYDTTRITQDEIEKHAEHLHNKLKRTPTHENKAKIKFLDLLITRQTYELYIDIYRKPTTTDTTINYISNHPMKHKLAAYRYYMNRMITRFLNEEKSKQSMENYTKHRP
jgi:hypothetical protein